jgi:hypothetical protein
MPADRFGPVSGVKNMGEPARAQTLMVVDCLICGQAIHFQKPALELREAWASETLTCPVCGDTETYPPGAMRPA